MEEIDRMLERWVFNTKIRAEFTKAIIHMVNDKKIEAFKAGVKHAHDIECPVCGSKTN
tara:strand:- start:486 stop:659 length:174 start_codon:yes stop_codon:yes gene_type:complete